MTKSIIQQTFEASRQVDEWEVKQRTQYSVFASAASELGELATEIRIDSGDSYKEPGPDGVIVESIDTILCLIDLIYKTDPTITEAQINEIVSTKLSKWKKFIEKQHIDDKMKYLRP